MPFDAGAVLGRLELGLEGWKKSVETVEKDQQSMTGFALRHSEEIQKLGQKFVIAGAAITGALGAIVISAAKAGDNFDEMSERTGISTEVLSTLKLAADKSGTSIDSVAAGMKFLAAQMIETANATDKSKTVLGALGIEAKDLVTGKMRPLNDVLFEVADRFKGTEDGAVKVKLAVALFGRAGMDLIPILNLGSKGLKENEEAARKLGIEWSGPDTKAAAAFDDAIKDLNASKNGLVKTIALSLMPATKGLIEDFTGAVVKIREWVKENPALVEGILKFAGGLGIGLTVAGTFLIVVANVIKALAILKIQAATPIMITIGILGGVALAKGLEEIRTFYEKNVSHKYIAQEERDWQSLIRTMGEWTTIAEEISRSYSEQNQYSAESGKLLQTLDDIWQKYGNSSEKAIKAVLAGEAGPAAKKLLTDLMVAHGGAAQAADGQAAATDKAKDATIKLSPELQKLLAPLGGATAATKTLKEELGLTFNADLQSRIDLIKSALEKYKGQLSPESEQKLKDELSKLSDEMVTGGLVTSALANRYKNELKPELIKFSETIKNTALPAARKMPQAVLDMIPPGTNAAWASLSDQLMSDFTRAVGSVLTGTASLQDGFQSLVSSGLNLLIDALLKSAIQAVIAGKAIGAAAYASLGPWGLILAAILAVVSVLTMGFTSAGDKAAESFQNNLKNIQKEFQYLGDISDETAGKISRAMMSGATEAAAVAANLAQMMRDTGITVDNFDIYLSKATNTLTLMEKGLLDTAEGSKLADEQFALLVEAAKKLGTEGSEAMINFIKTSREMGLELASVNAYTIEQLNKIPAALTTMIAASDNSATSLAGLGEIALTTFEGMIAAGTPWYEAVQAMAEPLKALAQKYKDLGMEADTELAELMKIVGVTEAHKGLFDAISANDTILKALSNSGYLNAESMKTLTNNVQGYYAELIKNGMTEDQALRAMKVSLQDIYDASVANGIPLDATTQALVDQAKAAGLVKDKVDMGEVANKTLTVLEKMLALFEKMFGAAGDTKGVLESMNGQTYGYDMQENWSTNNPGTGGGGGSGGGGGTCFVAGTPITMADGSKRPIELIRVGDEVLSWDTLTWKSIPGRVSALITHAPEEVKKVVMVNGIGATPEHPFYINGSWRQIGDANIGDHLVSAGGWLIDIFQKEWGPGGVTVYNLTLENMEHDYFAGGVLVHNIEQKPEYALGGFVPFTGPAIVHAGEWVIPPDQVAAMTSGGGGSRPSIGGNTATVNINGPLVATSGISESDLEQAGERLLAIVERQFKRRGWELANA